MAENRHTENTKRDIIKENVDSQSYKSQEPGPFPLNFAGCEDQPRLHTTVRRKDNNLAFVPVVLPFPGSGRFHVG